MSARSKQFQHACRFLWNDAKLAPCLTLIERNARLLRQIQRALPSPLDEHCLHASLQSGELTLVTDSPVWASRLRFFTPEIERSLDRRFGPVSSCRIRIRPGAAAPLTAPKHRLSSQAAQHLMDAAEGIADAALASALRRIAKAGFRAR
jgi:hypothetical protein